MAGLPTGTVTFLFTDIEGSTRLLQQLGDRYADLLVAYRRLLHDTYQKRGAHEVDTQGDALFVVFSRAKDAIEAAVAAQQAVAEHSWPDEATVRVRMGLHTGQPLTVDAGYVGLDVHRAARICAAGHGGQVLLSSTTRELIQHDLPEGVQLRDMGLHHLKDLAHPQRLFQPLSAGLPSDFPPLKTLDTLPNNLPRLLSSFVGREREIAEIKRLLSTTSILTLTGAGGSGKTRLALHVGADLLEQYPDGVWFVELATLSNPALVPQAVASALGLHEQPERSLIETLVDYMRSKSLLVVLDNCEHLLVTCADLAERLLSACPTLRIIATSREGLRIAGETLYPIPSFRVPDPRRMPSLEDLAEYEAVRLFAERATAVAPTFKVTQQNALAVAQVCHRLDGIPLAIELAAVRVKALAVEQIADRLDHRLRLLTGGGRTAPPRHQTLRATIDWSYDLLSENERVLLRRLSVFAGGCTLDAAEVVCVGDGLEVAEILELLTRLIDRSLVAAETRGKVARYRLLETVRQYGLERLRQAAEEVPLRRRHRDYYLTFAESAEPKLWGSEEAEWLEQLETEHDNLRAALDWTRNEHEETGRGLRVATALWAFWESRGHLSEGRAWLEEMVSLAAQARPLLKARALNAAGTLAHRQGDYEGVSALCGQALILSQAEASKPDIAWALHLLGHAAEERGDHASSGDLRERSLALYREAGDKWGVAWMTNCMGDVARSQGNFDRAADFLEEALALCREMNTKRLRIGPLHNLGQVLLRQRNRQRAAALFTECIDVARELGNTRSVISGVAGLAGVHAEGAPELAARLLGAADALRASAGQGLQVVDRTDFEWHVGMVRSRLGERAFDTAWADGRTMTLDEAVAEALTLDTSRPLRCTSATS